MKLSVFKTPLAQEEDICFQLPNGQFVPAHFHINEVGQATRTFMDCGGTTCSETAIRLQ